MADIGWLELSEADVYFTTRLQNAKWTALTDAQKTAALTTAYNRIRYLRDYTIPSSPTAAQQEILADAECELAYYLIIHMQGEDRRKGIQAQGVTGAGIVKETYDKDMLADLPLPPIVKTMLDSFYDLNSQLYAVDIDRDEDEQASEDVTDFS